MSLDNINTRLAHDRYEADDESVRQWIDECFSAVKSRLQTGGFKTSSAARAEELVAAIYYYYERSQEHD